MLAPCYDDNMDELIITDKKGRPAELPDFAPGSLIDTHTHLGMQDNPSLCLARAATTGLGAVITICDPGEEDDDEVARTYASLEDWRAEARDILDNANRTDLKVPSVGVLIGLHPHHAKLWSPEVEASIREHAVDPRTVGLGEMGLDYHFDYSPREVQRKVFARQLELAHELKLPVCLHLREAHEDGFKILQEGGIPERGAVLHCFNLDYEVAAPFVELGCVVSFAGPLTFKKAEEVREAAQQVPFNKLMVETDAPFMSPEPVRGTTCEPAFTAFTAAKLAEVRGVSLNEIAEQTTACARRIYAPTR